MKFKLLTDLCLSLVVAESRFEADFFLSFSEDLIRIADRDFFASAIFECCLTPGRHVAMQRNPSRFFLLGEGYEKEERLSNSLRKSMK